MGNRTQPPANGVPTWIDFMCADSDASVAFFSTLLSWTAEPGDEEFGGYRTAALGGRHVTGFGPGVAPGMPDVQSVYLACDDIAGTLKRAKELGASVMDMGGTEQMQVGDHGSMAVLADPAGATIGLWQAERMIGFEAIDEPGAPTWFEIMTRDIEAAKGFYADLFGAEWSHSAGDPSMDYWVATLGGGQQFGLMAMPPEMPAEIPAHWMGYYQVPDIDAATAQALALGGDLVAGPNDIPDGRWVNLRAPGGAVFALFSPAEAQ